MQPFLKSVPFGRCGKTCLAMPFMTFGCVTWLWTRPPEPSYLFSTGLSIWILCLNPSDFLWDIIALTTPSPFCAFILFFFCFSNFSYCPRTWPSLIRAKFWLLRPITLFRWMLILKPSLLMFSPILANFRPVHSFFLFFF